MPKAILKRFIDSPLQQDPYWRDQLLFHEYFHAQTGQGLGASRQTGWNALVSKLLLRYANKAAAPSK